MTHNEFLFNNLKEIYIKEYERCNGEPPNQLKYEFGWVYNGNSKMRLKQFEKAINNLKLRETPNPNYDLINRMNITLNQKRKDYLNAIKELEENISKISNLKVLSNDFPEGFGISLNGTNNYAHINDILIKLKNNEKLTEDIFTYM